jgi:uncharacterized membrane protein (Fun14 family)
MKVAVVVTINVLKVVTINEAGVVTINDYISINVAVVVKKSTSTTV